eukprot:4787816-Alexandrium_andersonii.AAC.1
MSLLFPAFPITRRSPRRPRRTKPLSVRRSGRSVAVGPGLPTGPRPAWGRSSASRIAPAVQSRGAAVAHSGR